MIHTYQVLKIIIIQTVAQQNNMSDDWQMYFGIKQKYA